MVLSRCLCLHQLKLINLLLGLEQPNRCSVEHLHMFEIVQEGNQFKEPLPISVVLQHKHGYHV